MGESIGRETRVDNVILRQVHWVTKSEPFVLHLKDGIFGLGTSEVRRFMKQTTAGQLSPGTIMNYTAHGVSEPSHQHFLC